MTQCEIIKQHLETYGGITPMEAMMEYGIMRLGARIFDLKDQGMPIHTKMVRGRNRRGETTHYAEYTLIREETNNA